MKHRLPTDKGTARINTLVRLETYKNVQLVAAETGRTVSSAVDYLLREGLRRFISNRDTTDDRLQR